MHKIVEAYFKMLFFLEIGSRPSGICGLNRFSPFDILAILLSPFDILVILLSPFDIHVPSTF